MPPHMARLRLTAVCRNRPCPRRREANGIPAVVVSRMQSPESWH